MTRPLRIATPVLTILTSAFIGSLIVLPLSASATDPHAPDSYERPHTAHDIIQGPHVEGHIAFLHAELSITPAQEPLWTPVADVMREDVKNMQEAENKIAAASNSSESAIEYLKNRIIFANLRAEGEQRFLKAFAPLYEKLSDAQKAMADELLAPRTPD